MSGAIATLGYSSRTEAVLAMRRQGRTTREIAEAIGIDVKTVSALECSAARWPKHAGDHVPRPSFDVVASISLNTRQRLRPAAAARQMNVEQLMRLIIEKVAEDGLVDAVLDDRDLVQELR
ncbi:hypothetical protein [Mesorhizobium sp. J428]|uniref:hypothetical protein n=1 Tax=Mesorhizobium sp. J428 TaxID=2898440 RepID=UPI00215116F6|nr:hypothetical protein [Mesorhizobium sp. J428]MCR5855969.1 hypothetical protein [Mesorhizobium sp. J428]